MNQQMIASCRRQMPDDIVLVCATVIRVRTFVVRNGICAGRQMALVTLQDVTGSIEGVIFSDVFDDSEALLQEGYFVSVQGRIDVRGDERKLIVEQMQRVRSRDSQSPWSAVKNDFGP